MPELPEVEVVRAGLALHLPGKKINQVKTFHNRTIRNYPGSAQDFARRLAGKEIVEIRRRGKFLWWVLSDEHWVVSAHLGMSGQFILLRKTDPLPKHVRAIFEFSNSPKRLIFTDQRTFGWLNLEEVTLDKFGKLIPRSVMRIKPDLFSNEFNIKETIDKLRARKTCVKSALLNQELISGVGNIYADEALWYAKLDWKTPANEVTVRQYQEIFNALKRVMNQALKAGGTSFDELYINVNGESGQYESRLRAYGRAGQNCYRCKSKLIRENFGVGRGSTRCPQCQKRKSVNR